MVGLDERRNSGALTSSTGRPELPRGDALEALHVPVTAINKLDVGTKDDWIPRHPDLIRLTGRWVYSMVDPAKGLGHPGEVLWVIWQCSVDTCANLCLGQLMGVGSITQPFYCSIHSFGHEPQKLFYLE